MTFLTPFAFLLLALIPPIIALYLLKLRRQDHLVSSTYLWQRFVRDVEANAPWQKLRRNLLLLLQILFLLLLILALTRPATEAEGVAGRTVVLILDISASMAATDGDDNGLTRLDAAKTAARTLVTNLPDNARITVLAAAGGEVETLASASQDRRQVLTAIASAQTSALSSDLEPALTLAEAIVAREPGAEIVLLSDGVVQVPEQLSTPIRFIPVGQSGANQAISVLSVTSNQNGLLTLFVQVSNYDTQLSQRRLVIRADDAPFTALDLTIPAGGHAEQSLENLPATTQIVEASLTPNETDFLPLDNQAWAVVRTGTPVQATLVTSGNFFLQTALTLLSSQPMGLNLNLTVISPEDWLASQKEPDTQAANLYIFDSYMPDVLPPGNALFIAPPTSMPDLFDVMGQVVAPVPQPVQDDHPLLQNVDLSSTQILTTTVLSATNWSQAVVVGEISPSVQSEPPTSVPLLLAGEFQGQRFAVLAFKLQQSDLPLRPAFPILVANLLNYLAPSAAILVPPNLAPGQTVSVSVSAQVNNLRLTAPSGAEINPTSQSGRVNLPSLAQLGLYTLVSGSTEGEINSTHFVVNFLNPEESDIAPQPGLTLTRPTGSEAVSVPLPPAQREWWRPLTLGALILLVIEWLVYQRSTVFRYWALLRQRVS